MHLDDRQSRRSQRVQNGDRAVRIGAGVDDDSVGALPRLVDPVDEQALVVGLTKLDRHRERLGALQTSLLDVGQGLVAIDLRLAQAEQVEIRSVEDQDRWIARQSAALRVARPVPYSTQGI